MDTINNNSGIKPHESIQQTMNIPVTQCIECGSVDLYCEGSINEPRMCLPCFAAMTGFVWCGDKNSFVDMGELEFLGGATS